MSEVKEKTKFGKFLRKVGNFFPDVAEVGLEVLASGSPMGAISVVANKLKDKSKEDSELGLQATALAAELERDQHDFIRDMEENVTERTKSAHELEKVQLQQGDLFTKRARPTRQYAWIVFLFACYPIAWYAKGQVVDLPEFVVVGIFTDFGFYTYKRTQEKLNIKNPLQWLRKKA